MGWHHPSLEGLCRTTSWRTVESLLLAGHLGQHTPALNPLALGTKCCLTPPASQWQVRGISASGISSTFPEALPKLGLAQWLSTGHQGLPGVQGTSFNIGMYRVFFRWVERKERCFSGF